MAQWIPIGPVANSAEKRACQYLQDHLPRDYTFYSNVSLTDQGGHSWDYDVILLGRHAVYVIELKNYGGTIRGDRYQWILPDCLHYTPPGDVLTTVANKARILKTKLKNKHNILGRVYVHSLVCLTGRKGEIAIQDNPKRLSRVLWLEGTEEYLTNEKMVPVPDGWHCETGDITRDHLRIQSVLDNRQEIKPLEKHTCIGPYTVMDIAWRSHRYRYTALFAGIDGVYPPQSLLKVYPIPDTVSRVDVDKTIQRFKREISALRIIRDREARDPRSGIENVIAAYDAFVHPDGRYYVMVMEWVNGDLLSHKLRKGKGLPQSDRAGIAAQICRGLACAHRAGIVHRNLTPENIIVGWDGTAKLINFNFAKFLPEQGRLPLRVRSASHLTRVLDWNYVAPEIHQGSYHQANKASDIYAAGLVLSELCSGVPPVAGERKDNGLFRHVSGQSSEMINRVIGTMCSLRPEERLGLSLYEIATHCDGIAKEQREAQV